MVLASEFVLRLAAESSERIFIVLAGILVATNSQTNNVKKNIDSNCTILSKITEMTMKQKKI